MPIALNQIYVDKNLGFDNYVKVWFSFEDLNIVFYLGGNKVGVAF